MKTETTGAQTTSTPLPQSPEEKQPLQFTVNAVLPVAGAPGGSKFFAAGSPTPYTELSEAPPNLRAFAVTGPSETVVPDEGLPDEPLNACFQLGVTYQITEDGLLGRALSRQAAAMKADNALQDFAAEQLSEPLAPEIAAALEDQHSAHITKAIAQAALQKSPYTHSCRCEGRQRRDHRTVDRNSCD